jgi:hypothetical protein
MTTRTEIGKIENCIVGHGGYQNAMIGVSFTLSGKSWGVSDFWGTWSCSPDKQTKWTKQDQLNILGETFLRLEKLLVETKVDDVRQLVGKPVQVTFEGGGMGMLKSWRILSEVL